MKKIKSRILLGFGVIATLATAGSVVLSCGNSNSNKNKDNPILQGLDDITSGMVKAAITTVLTPTTSNPTPDAPTNNEFTNLSINGLDDVTITIANWTKDIDLGSVSFSIVSISKDADSVHGDKLGIIAIFGFLSNQSKLDNITAEMVKVAITKALAPTTSNLVPEAPKNNEFTNLSINGLDDVTITIANWTKDIDLGSASFSIVQLIKGHAIEDGRKFGKITISGFSSDQSKLDGITSEMITTVITTVFAPTTSNPVPETPKNNEFTNLSINGLDDVTITIANWVKDIDLGSVSFSIVQLIKGPAIEGGSKFGTITISGFSSDQSKLDGITTDMVKSTIIKILSATPEVDVPGAPMDNKFTGITINELSDVTITISNWVRDTTLGSVSFSVVQLVKGPAIEDGNKFGKITISGFVTDKLKLNGITVEDIKKIMISKLNPSLSTPIVDMPIGGKIDVLFPSHFNSSYAPFSATIAFASWTGNIKQGAITFTIKSISEDLAVRNGQEFGSITIDGFYQADTTIITYENEANYENKLWEWDANDVLTINYGVTGVGEPYGAQIGQLGSHDVGTLKSIVFPSTLLEIGQSFIAKAQQINILVISASVLHIWKAAFKSAPIKSLQFLGDIPSVAPKRTLILESTAFGSTPISSIVDGDKGDATTAAKWQEWLTTYASTAFKK